MVKYIFDLDYTLYSKSDVNDKGTDKDFYDSFKPKEFMNHLLSKLDGNNFIFTNGNFGGAIKSGISIAEKYMKIFGSIINILMP